MKHKIVLLLVLAGVASTSPCYAEEAPAKQDEKGGRESLLGDFKFGVGIGFENYKGGYINEAETVGTTRVVRSR